MYLNTKNYSSSQYSKLFYLALLLIFMIFQGCKPEAVNKLNPIEEEKILLEKVNDFNQAFKECDIEALETLITENYLHTNGNSRVIRKDAWLEYLKKRKLEISSGNLVVNTYDMKEVEIELHNDMAIVTGKIIISSSTKLGEHNDHEYRITNIWVKEEGNWKRAGFHDGKIK